MVRRAIEAFNRGDLEAVVVDFDPDIEYTTSGRFPDAHGTWHGPEEYVRFLRTFWSEFDDPRAEVEELVDAGDQVLACQTINGRGKKSGAEVSVPLFQLWTIRDGAVVGGRGFMTRAEAREAAGLAE